MNTVVITQAEGQTFEMQGMRIQLRVPGATNGDRFSVVEITAAPSFRGPPIRHRHTDIEWMAQVTGGTLVLEADGVEHVVPAGDFAVVPRGSAFRWWNGSADEPVRFTCTYTPGGFDRYFIDVAKAFGSLGRPPVPEDMGSLLPPLWAKHGIEMAK